MRCIIYSGTLCTVMKKETMNTRTLGNSFFAGLFVVSTMSLTPALGGNTNNMNPEDYFHCYLIRESEGYGRTGERVSISASTARKSTSPGDTSLREASAAIDFFYHVGWAPVTGTCEEIDSDQQMSCSGDYWSMEVDFSEQLTFHHSATGTQVEYYRAHYREWLLGVIPKGTDLYCVHGDWPID